MGVRVRSRAGAGGSVPEQVVLGQRVGWWVPVPALLLLFTGLCQALMVPLFGWDTDLMSPTLHPAPPFIDMAAGWVGGARGSHPSPSPPDNFYLRNLPAQPAISPQPPCYPEIIPPCLDVTPKSSLSHPMSHPPFHAKSFALQDRGCAMAQMILGCPLCPPCLMVLGAGKRALAWRGRVHLSVPHSPRSAQQ